ncbi:MAG: magnesium transporter [Patescibacteria group bacterium]
MAGYYMVSAVPVVQSTATIGSVERLLENQGVLFTSINYIYVVNLSHQLVGVVSIKEIFSQAKEVIVSTLIHQKLITVTPETNTEKMVRSAFRHRIKAVPVVDGMGHFLGVVSSNEIISLLHTKRVDDALRHAGSQTFENPAESILYGSVWLHVRKRLPWLVAGLGGGLIGAMIVRSFETTLAEQLLVAAFIPTVIYMADAVGSQTEIIFIRALALEHNFKFARYFTREFWVNMCLAGLLGVGMLTIAAVWLQNVLLACVLGLAIFFTTMSSVLVALLIPYLFERLGYDPAVASSPMATIIRNILSLAIYFLIVVALL